MVKPEVKFKLHIILKRKENLGYQTLFYTSACSKFLFFYNPMPKPKVGWVIYMFLYCLGVKVAHSPYQGPWSPVPNPSPLIGERLC